MKIQFVALGLLAFSGLTWSVQADIAPTRFTGSGIVARSETSIRMQRADVDIVWGTPCELTATFEMVNSSGTPKDMRMGFPMPSGEFESRPTIDVGTLDTPVWKLPVKWSIGPSSIPPFRTLGEFGGGNREAGEQIWNSAWRQFL
jgi:hypothetical protein